ncbi:unnamed protein product [Dibothriocephalus latus]|uniref:Uncharacterized protein n=1 Tax=Dibothriocephalus latus TaxID=60516 RepID=A0A3P7QTM1_DIBLA|nr:unnamed protein product [Dibothriocephalus latus]
MQCALRIHNSPQAFTYTNKNDSKMARNYPAETRAQKVYEERYEKELVAQLRYFTQHQTEMEGEGPNVDSSPATEIRRRRMKIVSDSLLRQFLETPKTRDSESGGENQSLDGQPTESEACLTAVDLNEMAPVDPELKNIIYEGISQESMGR